MSESDETTAPRRRARRGGGGAQARRALRTEKGISTLPTITRRIPLYEPWSDEALDVIENNAERILAEIGVEFADDGENLSMWRDAGADVDGTRVRLPRGLAKTLIADAPERFIQTARNPERDVEIGGDKAVLAPVYGPPFVRDLNGKRRYASLEDFQNFARLIYMSPALHHAGGTLCEPVDIPVNKRHLDMIAAHARLSDKPFMGSVTAPERAADSVDMARIALGERFADDDKKCSLVSLININSPLAFDDAMVGSLKVYARAGQATIIAPFILSGAMAATTVAGTLTQIFAEALAGMAFAQLCRKGAPVIFGTFASSMSMQTGAPTFGTPEPALVVYGAGQLARRLRVPFRSGGGLCGSKVPDAQAAYESAASMWPAILGGANFCLHSAGWLEGGLVASFEKLVMDADQNAMLQTFCGGVDVSENAQAMDAIAEVGPGGHFLGCAHTRRNFETAFWRSRLADNASFEQWSAEGERDIAHRANALCRDMLAAYEPPPIDPADDEALEEFIVKKKASMPDAFV